MASVKEITVTTENAPGKAAEIIGLLHDNGVFVLGLSAETTAQTGTVRLMTNDPEKSRNILEGLGFTVEEKQVIAVRLPDHPGSLYAVLKPLADAGVNVAHVYGLWSATGSRIAVLGVPDVKKSVELLGENWFHLCGEELYQL